MGTLRVVVRNEYSQDLFQVARAKNQEPVQTLPAHGAHPALGKRIRARVSRSKNRAGKWAAAAVNLA
jgi:hypothetical protein